VTATAMATRRDGDGDVMGMTMTTHEVAMALAT
jgi:hypothetical protein